MRQVRFLVAPFSLLAAFSGSAVIATPVSQSSHVVGSTSSALISAAFPLSKSVFLSANSVLAQANPEPSPSPSPSVSPSPRPLTPSPTPSVSPTTSSLLLEKNGELSPTNSSVLEMDGSLFDQYSFEGRQGQKVTITVESLDFDTYLALFDSAGKLLGEADDMGESCNYQDEKSKKDFISKGLCNSTLSITLPASGNYKVIVNGRDKTDRGKYTLTVRNS
ncbi:MAG TPA: PPC domain-containing protein [Kamptonema sp.]|nr:PPC domain-containing protein [Kamptonema sp.]